MCGLIHDPGADPRPVWRGAALFAFLVLVSILALVGLEVALEWIAGLVYGALS